MSVHQPQVETATSRDEREDMRQIDPMLAVMRAAGRQNLEMDVDLAFAMQELYEDLANTYLTMSETLRAYVVDQQARGAVLSSRRDQDRGEADRYSS